MPSSELNELLNAMLPAAQQMLAEKRGFFPFGATMSPTGEILTLSGKIKDVASDEFVQPGFEEMVAYFTSAFHHESQSGNLRAAGLCCNVSMQQEDGGAGSDAICCSLESQLGEALNVFVPYTIAEDGTVAYGQLFAGAREPEFFEPQPPGLGILNR